jgi:hypothetical protein
MPQNLTAMSGLEIIATSTRILASIRTHGDPNKPRTVKDWVAENLKVNDRYAFDEVLRTSNRRLRKAGDHYDLTLDKKYAVERRSVFSEEHKLAVQVSLVPAVTETLASQSAKEIAKDQTYSVTVRANADRIAKLSMMARTGSGRSSPT